MVLVVAAAFDAWQSERMKQVGLSPSLITIRQAACMLLFDICECLLFLLLSPFVLIPFDSDTVYHFCEGHDATSHASFGEAAHIAVTLHMHEEASYEGLDPIEREVRKRAFWLLFGGTFFLSAHFLT